MRGSPGPSPPPLVSVVVPVGAHTPHLSRTRRHLAATATPLEVLLVVDRDLSKVIHPRHPHERVIPAGRRGRGFACVQGAREARGEIVVFLHADTLLPLVWERAITNVLRQSDVVGGAFSLSFDGGSRFLKVLILLSDLLFRLTGELWGDRAIFVRSRCLEECLPSMDVPIMEDVRLSHCMKRQGKVLMLKESVTTSSERFRSGVLNHAFRILKCRLLYALGGDLDRIWKCYYQGRADPRRGALPSLPDGL